MNLRRHIALILFGVTSLAGAAEETPAPESLADHPQVRGALNLIDRWIETHQVYERIPSIAVGIVLDQDLIWSKGFGYANTARKTPADDTTLYSICSISKLFTSIALMQQRDAGRLQLDDPVAAHLNWFDLQQSYDDSGPITIRALLTHSSGLPRESINHYWNPDYPFPSRSAMIDALSDQETLYPAGTYFQYSNLALTLVGEIAASSAGKPYEALVQDAILTPLGLTDTRPFLPEDQYGKTLAIGYGALNREGKRNAEPPFDTAGITPAAGFTSNVRDLARFASWQFRLLENGGEEVLKASTLREMQRVQWTDPDWKITWGLGFSVQKAGEDTLVGHGGGCPGYITAFSMMPKHKLGVIVLTNGAATEPDAVSRNIYKVLGPALKAARTETDPVPDLADFEGRYDPRPWNSEVVIVQIGDQLAAASLPSSDPTRDLIKLKQIDGDLFSRVREKEDDPGETWTFDRNPDGKVVAVRYHGAIMPKVE